jgi:hypothetical protein
MDKIIEDNNLNLEKYFPDVVNDVRNCYQNVKTGKCASKSTLSDIYYATMRSATGSISSVAKLLQISANDLKAYIEESPEATMTYRAALIDKRAELQESLTKILIDATINGQITKEIRVEDNGFSKKTITTKRKTPPDPKMALEILKRLDPNTWGDKVEIKGEINTNEMLGFKVVDNVNIAVDYRKLSKDTLRDLINSQATSENTESFKREDGVSTIYLEEARKNNKLKQKQDKPVKSRKKKARTIPEIIRKNNNKEGNNDE